MSRFYITHGADMYGIHPAKFWKKVLKSEDPDGCWLWQGGVNHSGYGLIYGYEDGKRKVYFAHRYSFWLHNGYLTEGLIIMHSCDTRRCVAEHHISEGSIADNNYDKEMKGRGGQRSYERHNLAVLTWPQVRKIRELYATEQYSAVQLAEVYQMHHSTISKIINNELWFDPEYDLPRFDNKHFQATKLSWDIAGQVRSDYASGMKNGHIATRYQISPAMVSALVANTKWIDLSYTPPPKQSVSERYSKLTPDQVLAIRSRAEGGARVIDLAHEYEVDDSNIIAIVKRKSWKDI